MHGRLVSRQADTGAIDRVARFTARLHDVAEQALTQLADAGASSHAAFFVYTPDSSKTAHAAQQGPAHHPVPPENRRRQSDPTNTTPAAAQAGKLPATPRHLNYKNNAAVVTPTRQRVGRCMLQPERAQLQCILARSAVVVSCAAAGVHMLAHAPAKNVQASLHHAAHVQRRVRSPCGLCGGNGAITCTGVNAACPASAPGNGIGATAQIIVRGTRAYICHGQGGRHGLSPPNNLQSPAAANWLLQGGAWFVKGCPKGTRCSPGGAHAQCALGRGVLSIYVGMDRHCDGAGADRVLWLRCSATGSGCAWSCAQ